RDHRGARHVRAVELSRHQLICRDVLDGNAEKAVIRWRLEPADWLMTNNRIKNGACEITIESDAPSMELRVVKGRESRYYLQSSPLPVLEIHLPVPALVQTHVSF